MPKEYGTPGPRAIYPELCDSRSLARCGMVANALWPRLVAKADDQGRLAGDAADVLAECFPKMLAKVTLRQVQTALDELVGVGQVIAYVVDGEPYLQLRTWWNWQHGQRRAYPSRHPAPDGWTDYVYGFDDNPRTLREAQGREPRKRRDEPSGDPDLSTDDPIGNGTGTAPEPRAAVADPHGAEPEPHGAALARAQPRVRGAVPMPMPLPDRTTTPNPRQRGPRNGVARHPGTDYNATLQRDSDDDPIGLGPAKAGAS